MREKLIGMMGIIVILGMAFAFCPHDRRRSINGRTVGGGLLILFLFAILVLKTPARVLFKITNDVVSKLLDFSKEGATFVFGRLVSDTDAFGYIFAFHILPTIIFFAAFMSVLYFIGLMPWIIRQMARAMTRLLSVSGAESFSTVSDIFVGMTEAPLVIRPYLASMTVSELMACMTAGLATTAGGVLAAYIVMLRDFVPDIAGHLIACSVMCAPAAIVIAKLMLPETESPQTLGRSDIEIPRNASNLMEAITIGTLDGLRLAVNVAAMLIAFLALLAMVNFCLGWLGEHVLHVKLSLERICGWLFAPLAWLMGVPHEDVLKVASLLGQKTVLNEFIAYTHMSEALKADPGWLTERGRLIASYALCGFANFGSVGITIGGYTALAPSRRPDISRLSLRAMLAGFLTTCLVATVAGLML